jgi:hypothetical protein
MIGRHAVNVRLFARRFTQTQISICVNLSHLRHLRSMVNFGVTLMIGRRGSTDRAIRGTLAQYRVFISQVRYR